MNLMTSTASSLSESRASAILPAAFVLMFGVFMVYGTAFAQPQALHNIAHDTRHAMAFPCH